MGNIMTEPVRQYLEQWYRPLNPFLEELRLCSEKENIPIIMRDTEMFMVNLLRLKNPARILEIGTAVGYSSLFFAALLPECTVTTLELSQRSCEIARENFRKAGCSHRIQVICGDARETLPALVQEILPTLAPAGEACPPLAPDREACSPFAPAGEAVPLLTLAEETLFASIKEEEEKKELRFDFVFIDGAKGHYLEFWEGCRPLWEKHALILSDNVLYKGITASEEYLTCRRDKTIMRRMREFLTHITGLSEVQTSVLAVGDGLAVSTVWY